MQATYIATGHPTEANTLTPEKLAACLARYSRSNKGIQTLLEEAKDKNPEEIFKFLDYGHASIGGLTGGIAIALDGITMLLALKIFEFAQMADGQESSTRYISLSPQEMPDPEKLGVPVHLQPHWKKTCLQGMNLYQYCLEKLQKKIEENPAQANLPEKALQNPKILKRMLKNYALDRARNLLPATLKTNMALVMSARSWAETIKLTDSLPLKEAHHTAAAIRTQLQKAAPNLIKHSFPDDASSFFTQELLSPWQTDKNFQKRKISQKIPCQCAVKLLWSTPTFLEIPTGINEAFTGKTNRYSQISHLIKRQTIQVEWKGIALAEVRDLTRHRTGFRTCDLNPKGFEIPPETENMLETHKRKEYQNFLENQELLIHQLAETQTPGLHTLGLFLGSQVTFEHTQQLDKFLYEAELRTGLGAHFKYAELLKTATHRLLEQKPELQRHIHLGEAEPE